MAAADKHLDLDGPRRQYNTDDDCISLVLPLKPKNSLDVKALHIIQLFSSFSFPPEGDGAIDLHIVRIVFSHST